MFSSTISCLDQKHSQWLSSEKVAWKAESQQSMSSLFRSTLLCRKTMHKEYSFQLCCSDWFNNLSVDTEKHNFMFSKQSVTDGTSIEVYMPLLWKDGVLHTCLSLQKHCSSPIPAAVPYLDKAKPSHKEWDLPTSSREMLFCSLHLHWRLLAAAVAQDALKDDSGSIVTCFSMSSDNLIKPHKKQTNACAELCMLRWWAKPTNDKHRNNNCLFLSTCHIIQQAPPCS